MPLTKKKKKNSFVLFIFKQFLKMIRTIKYINYLFVKNVSTLTSGRYAHSAISDVDDKPKEPSKRLADFRKKLRETSPIDDLGEQTLLQPVVADDPLPPFPNNTNPITGEVGGPKGPEPTRYGDWERKGRVSDF